MVKKLAKKIIIYQNELVEPFMDYKKIQQRTKAPYWILNQTPRGETIGDNLFCFHILQSSGFYRFSYFVRYYFIQSRRNNHIFGWIRNTISNGVSRR